MSRSLGVDVVTGEGLAEALEGVETVIDAASHPSPEQGPATDFFVASSWNLHRLGAQAGVQRLVVVSIIGIDRFSAGFLAAKKVHEQAVLEGPLPVRILRAAQFHEFVEPLVSWTRRENGVRYVPNMLHAAGRRPHRRRGAREPRDRRRGGRRRGEHCPVP